MLRLHDTHMCMCTCAPLTSLLKVPPVPCMLNCMSPFALCVTVYSDVLIDKGNATVEIGRLIGKVGDKFLVPIGRRTFINCDLEDAGGFPCGPSANPPLPVSIQWFKDGQMVDLRLFDSSHGNQLCVDARSANDSGNYECRVTSRIVNERAGDDTIFQTDSATSMVMVLSKCMVVVFQYIYICASSVVLVLHGYVRIYVHGLYIHTYVTAG